MDALPGVVWPPEPIATERLVVRATQASDRAACIELGSSAEVRRYLGGPHSRETLEQEMPEVPSAYPGVFAVEVAGSCAGMVILGRRSADVPGHVQPEGGELEIGYLLLPAYWGRGLAAEAVEAVLAWAWRQFPDEPVLLCTQVRNERSLALARRLGFEEVETFVEFDAPQWLGVRRRTVARRTSHLEG
jgi:RimJ/RimL family protein N-acetyltransferase